MKSVVTRERALQIPISAARLLAAALLVGPLTLAPAGAYHGTGANLLPRHSVVTAFGTWPAGVRTYAGTALIPAAKFYTLLWSFKSPDGIFPWAGLIADATGALYGTTFRGGAHDSGAVFKLSPSGSKYVESILWSFSWKDGANPVSGLMMKGGALYGTTLNGGVHGQGTVFELTPSGASYKERVLWSFGGQNGRVTDGQNPYAGVIARDGALYGTTENGGAFSYGTVFELAPSGASYTERVLWSFGNGHDGMNPNAALIAKSGALYGTTLNGGTVCCGTAFRLTPSGTSYTESILWSFGGMNDGHTPYAGLTADASGALYGTTGYGGTHDDGTVFKLTPSASGYTESVAWSFNGNDGEKPLGGLLLAGHALYGTTLYGGAYQFGGTVFKLKPSGASYTQRVLWSFGTQSQDGFNPYAGVITKDGALYGTTYYGGANGGDGTVFKLIP